MIGRIISGLDSVNLRSPLWFLRLNHTRLADAILDICDVGQKDVTREVCLKIFSATSACPPCRAVEYFDAPNKKGKSGSSQKSKSKSKKGFNGYSSQGRGGIHYIDRYLQVAVEKHGLSSDSAHKLRAFLAHGCLPLPANAEDAVDAIQEAIRRQKRLEIEDAVDKKRMKRYEDANKGLRHLRRILNAISTMGIYAMLDPSQCERSNDAKCSQPAYISIDLGIRQRNKYMHGSIFFQAVMLPDDYFRNSRSDDNNESLLNHDGFGVNVAEGGRYDDLVRKET